MIIRKSNNITISNNCSVAISDSIISKFNRVIERYNEENSTKYTLNDIKTVVFAKVGIILRFSPSNSVLLIYEDL